MKLRLPGIDDWGQWDSTSSEYQRITWIRSLTPPGRYTRDQRPDQIQDEVTHEWTRGIYQYCPLALHLALGPYYVKRYFYQNKMSARKGRRTVHFIASAASQVGDISTKLKLNVWKRENSWFGISTCSEGEITELEVADARHTGITGLSARRCGFGSILAYLCFRNIEHYDIDRPTTSGDNTYGFNIKNDIHWYQGNMPELRQELVFQHCRSIIHVSKNTLKEIPKQGAFVYGAISARYRHLITYNPSPCEQACCPYEGPRTSPDGKVKGLGWFKGKIFWLQGILRDFNVRNTQYINSNDKFSSIKAPSLQNTGNSAKGFAEHHGSYWYFCSMVPN